MLLKLYIISICAVWFFQLINPTYGMYLYPFFIFIRPDQWFEELQSYRLALITAIILLISCIMRGIDIKNKFFGCALLFVATALISILLAEEIDEKSIGSFTDLLKAVALALVSLWTIKKRKNFLQYGRFLLLCILCNGVYAFYQVVTQTGLDESGRSKGFMNDQNDTAGLMATAFPLAYYLFIHEKKKYLRQFYGICFLGIIFGLFSTVSRGGLITLTFSLVMIYRHNIKNIMALGLVFLLVIGFLYFAKDLYLSRETITTTMTGKTYLDASATKRLQLIGTALKIWADNRIWGIGMGRFTTAIVEGKRVTRQAHNAYLQILAEMGLIGLLGFLYMLKTFFATTRRINAHDPFYRDMALCCRIMGLSWMLFFLFAHSYLHSIFWLMLAFPFILEKLAAQEALRASAVALETHTTQKLHHARGLSI